VNALQGSPRRLAAVLSGIVVVGAFGICEAGIVILENGEVIVGKIAPSDVNDERIRVRKPQGEQGHMDVEQFRVRWFDVEADEPTDAYWEKHLDAPLLGQRWNALRERYIAGKNNVPEPLPPPLWIPPEFGLGPPVVGDGFEINQPRGWEATLEDGILMLRNPSPGRNGFHARVHVFAVRAAAAYDDQVGWIRGELERVSPARVEMIELKRLRTVDSGANQEMVTETDLGSRQVRALRKVCFRGERTYFVSAYADGGDFDAQRRLFQEVIDSLRLAEDA